MNLGLKARSRESESREGNKNGKHDGKMKNGIDKCALEFQYSQLTYVFIILSLQIPVSKCMNISELCLELGENVVAGNFLITVEVMVRRLTHNEETLEQSESTKGDTRW